MANDISQPAVNRVLDSGHISGPIGGGGEVEDDSGSYMGMDITAMRSEAELRKATTKHEHTLEILAQKRLENRNLLINAREAVRLKEKEEEEKKEKAKRMPPAELAKAREMGLNPMETSSMEQFFTFLQQMELKDYSLDHLLREAAQNFSDVSDQFAALSYARNFLMRQNTPESLRLAEEVRQAQEDIMSNEQLGPQVRAGLNVLGQAQTFQQRGLAPVAELRDFFRSSVLGFATITETYSQIIQQFGPHRFGEALEFLMKALGNDIAAARNSSLGIERLGMIMQDLRFIQVLGNLYRVFSDITEDVRTMFKIEEEQEEKEARHSGLSKEQRVQSTQSQQQRTSR